MAAMRDDVERIDLGDGRVAWRMGEVESLCRCACGVPFVPKISGQITCGAPVCQERRRYRNRSMDPRQREAAKERARRWAASNRSCVKVQPWLRGAPAYGTHLPGGGVELHISPAPRWPVEHRNIRQLHGLVTALTDEPHSRWPVFTLVPWPRGVGWGAYLWREDVALRLAGRTFEGKLYDRPVLVRCSPLVRVRAPALPKRGRQRVRLDTVTPVVITSDGHSRPHIVPTAASLLSALTLEFPLRLGLSDEQAAAVRTDGVRTREQSLARLEVIEHDARKVVVQVGAKYGAVIGWEGSCILEVNAVARWLLECAARTSLGGRGAFGFGRVRVSDADPK